MIAASLEAVNAAHYASPSHSAYGGMGHGEPGQERPLAPPLPSQHMASAYGAHGFAPNSPYAADRNGAYGAAGGLYGAASGLPYANGAAGLYATAPGMGYGNGYGAGTSALHAVASGLPKAEPHSGRM